VLAGAAVDSRQQPRELLDMACLEIARQQHRLPVAVGLGHGLHRQDMRGVIFEHKGGQRARCQPRQPAQPGRLAVDALGTAEPLHRHPQPFERLFEDPGGAIRALHQDGPVRHAARESLHPGDLARRDMPVLPQIGDQSLGLFDIQHGGRLLCPGLGVILNRGSIQKKGTGLQWWQ